MSKLLIPQLCVWCDEPVVHGKCVECGSIYNMMRKEKKKKLKKDFTLSRKDMERLRTK